jgi:hypothetical protein
MKKSRRREEDGEMKEGLLVYDGVPSGPKSQLAARRRSSSPSNRIL